MLGLSLSLRGFYAEAAGYYGKRASTLNWSKNRIKSNNIEAGKVVPVIERRYPLRETALALRYLEEGHARGKVVITVDQNDNT